MGDTPETLYRTGQVAKFFGVKTVTVARWIKEGKIKAYKPLGENAHWRVPESEVKRLLNKKYGDE